MCIIIIDDFEDGALGQKNEIFKENRHQRETKFTYTRKKPPPVPTN